MDRLLRGARRRMAEQAGVTMIVTLGALVVCSLFVTAVVAATNGDVHLTRNDLDQKRAYYAAQAGISTYEFQLNANVNYWEGCPSSTNVAVTATTPGAGGESYSSVPLAASTAPAADNGQCNTSDPIGSMIEGPASPTAAGSFRIKVTGYSGKAERSLVATFARASFLNYAYFSLRETKDPLYNSEPAACATYTPGLVTSTTGRPSTCPDIPFIGGDTINGPFHSEDVVSLCGGSPVIFGRVSSDKIEAPAITSDTQDGCSGTATIKGTYNAHAPHLSMPPSNTQLLITTQPAYHFLGVTTIVFNNNSTMTVTNANLSGGSETISTAPSSAFNGVVYVSPDPNRPCSVPYSPYGSVYSNADSRDAGCGDAYVSGSYSSSITVGAANDIVINGSLLANGATGQPTGTALLGLIANDFVRIYHPVTTRYGAYEGACGSAANAAGYLYNPTIDAAILDISHSFIVDNYDCGAPLGNLNVWGAIAQNFRGRVSTANAATAYSKNYNFDNRLFAAEPPYFINPVQAAWSVQRETECGQGMGSGAC